MTSELGLHALLRPATLESFILCGFQVSSRPVTRILCVGGGGGGANEAKVDQTTEMFFFYLIFFNGD